MPRLGPLGRNQEGSILPITNHTYDARSGEIVYTISAEEGAEEYKLAVTPMDRNRNQLTFWQGDHYDENNHLVAQSDPIRLEYEDDREDFCRIVETVFDPDMGEKRLRSSRATYASGVRRRAKGGGTSSAH
jgi:hypothetical protein